MPRHDQAQLAPERKKRALEVRSSALAEETTSPKAKAAKESTSPKAVKGRPSPKAKVEAKEQNKRSACTFSDASEEVLDLLQQVANLDELQRWAFAGGYDAVTVPLSKVTKSMAREGFTWLKAIERELAKPEPPTESLEALSQSFYKVVPLLANEGKESIATSDLFLRRLRVVSMLSDIEAAHSQLRLLLNFTEEAAAAGSRRLSTQHLQLIYKSLKCEISAETQHSTVSQMVEKYLRGVSTPQPWPGAERSDARLCRQFTLPHRKLRPADSTRLAKAPAKRLLLWYRTSFTAWLSLLANGFRLPPKEAPELGYSFGKGLYFFDAVEAIAESGQTLFLLAEVALGSSRQLDAPDQQAEKLPLNTQSVIGRGTWTPDPGGACKLDAMTVPLGQLQKGPEGVLQHNHYVVYNLNQVRIRYIVEVEMPRSD
ncbi:unnamed protein product [Durusdinium trenchii]|uniref:Poly [ADP-ribose] polymerase n=1 Tax=Durusdinium trenchii TaxID=1381693 RepID=A0ABP0IQA5_9DINO